MFVWTKESLCLHRNKDSWGKKGDNSCIIIRRYFHRFYSKRRNVDKVCENYSLLLPVFRSLLHRCFWTSRNSFCFVSGKLWLPDFALQELICRKKNCGRRRLQMTSETLTLHHEGNKSRAIESVTCVEMPHTYTSRFTLRIPSRALIG